MTYDDGGNLRDVSHGVICIPFSCHSLSVCFPKFMVLQFSHFHFYICTNISSSQLNSYSGADDHTDETDNDIDNTTDCVVGKVDLDARLGNDEKYEDENLSYVG